MSARLIGVFLVVLVAGCAEAPVQQPYTGPNVAFEHGTAAFWGALAWVKGYCSQAGLQARYLGSDYSPGIFALSRFECTDK